MFPPTEEEQQQMHLDRCMRILPHHQNTGGFFVAVFRKVGECPRLNETTLLPSSVDTAAEQKEKEDSKAEGEKNDASIDGKIDDSTAKDEAGGEDDEDDDDDDDDEKHDDKDAEENGQGDEKNTEKRAYSPPPNGKIKNAAFVEDPFVFLSWEKDGELLQNLKDFYGFGDDFPMEQVGCDDHRDVYDHCIKATDDVCVDFLRWSSLPAILPLRDGSQEESLSRYQRSA